jgi:hypothetical protein
MLLALASLVVVAFRLGRASAEGAPATQALTYSGTLSDSDGNPLTGPSNITLALWASETDTQDPLCLVTNENTDLVLGRFAIPLPDDCAARVHEDPGIWVEVSVDGASLGRVKVGAVPYALEATHAARATSADHSSAAFQVNGDLTVTGTSHIGWRSIACSPSDQSSAYQDCRCGQGEVAVSGGGYCPNGWLDESRAVGDTSDGLATTWRVACKDKDNGRSPPTLAYAYCAKIAPQ